MVEQGEGTRQGGKDGEKPKTAVLGDKVTTKNVGFILYTYNCGCVPVAQHIGEKLLT